jgi:hypothetical protein
MTIHKHFFVEISNGTMGDENSTMFQEKTWLHGLLFYVNF